jgi:hypothetical protein
LYKPITDLKNITNNEERVLPFVSITIPLYCYFYKVQSRSMTRQLLYCLLLLLLTPKNLNGQIMTSSNLPIVIIDTDGGLTIRDEPKLPATMRIIWRGPGERNYVSDQYTTEYLNYNGRIGIEIRGSSSQISPKKNYGFTTRMADNITNNNVSLLGMPEENDWILGGMVFDTALIRDYLCNNLSRRLGNYASRAVYCEVIINNDYKGLYMLQEKLKADDNRIDVIKIKETDNAYPDLTGGYLTKADKTTGGDPIAWTMLSFQNAPVDYIHELPKPENATQEQTAYIRNEFYSLESAAANNNTTVTNGYPSIIDIPSFIDFMIINEFASNPDAYQYSTFFHKDRNGKLRAGPIWDLDLSFGNDLFQWYLDRSKTYLWYFEDYYYNNGSTFWRDLFHNSQFNCYLSRRWNEVIQPGHPLCPDSLNTFIDRTVAEIAEAVDREYQRWGKSGSHDQRIAGIKTFMSERSEWITNHIGSYESCIDINVPLLTITKIMYHPQTTTQFPDDDELEFIEIRNTGNTVVNLSGIYFAGTGLVYQFPANSTLEPGLCVILASNASVFQSKYGFSPFGQFTRHLSNSSEALTLADAFGNVIDYVEYDDDSPWPDADGNGHYLALTETGLDNSLPENWTASNELITSVEIPSAETDFKVYPNPFTDLLTIRSGSEISSICIYDMQGRILSYFVCRSSYCQVDLSHLTPGTYIICVFTTEGSSTRKIIKSFF